MTLHAPQIIYLILLYVGVGISLQRNGTPKPQGNYNFWDDVLSMLLMFGLLWWGGFLR